MIFFKELQEEHLDGPSFFTSFLFPPAELKFLRPMFWVFFDRRSQEGGAIQARSFPLFPPVPLT